MYGFDLKAGLICLAIVTSGAFLFFGLGFLVVHLWWLILPAIAGIYSYFKLRRPKVPQSHDVDRGHSPGEL